MLMGQGLRCGGETGVNIFARGDPSGTALLIPIAADAKRAVGRSTAAGTDAVRVAVEDVRGEVAFDGPVAKGGFEGEEGREGLVGGYGGH